MNRYHYIATHYYSAKTYRGEIIAWSQGEAINKLVERDLEVVEIWELEK